MRKYKPKHLKPWTKPDHYMGEQYPDYYRSGFGQSRDSDLMERCNFAAALDALGGETPRGVIVTRASHWAVGWVESILINKNAHAKLKIGDELRRKVDAYPILDETSFYELEREEQEETLKNNLSEFTKELEKVLGRPLKTQDEVAEAVDLVSDAYFEDCGYRGSDEAWVTDKALKRYIESYEGKSKTTPIHNELREKIGA